jgi:uncharacterized membrane protein
MIDKIRRAKNLIEGLEEEFWTEEDTALYHEVLIAFASRLPSPSKINAYSVLISNTAEELADWLSKRTENDTNTI